MAGVAVQSCLEPFADDFGGGGEGGGDGGAVEIHGEPEVVSRDQVDFGNGDCHC